MLCMIGLPFVIFLISVSDLNPNEYTLGRCSIFHVVHCDTIVILKSPRICLVQTHILYAAYSE